MDITKKAKKFIEDFQCSDLNTWIEIRNFLLKKLEKEEAKIAVKEFKENDFIDLNTDYFLKQVVNGDKVKACNLFYQGVKENIDYILFGSKDWETPNIVNVMIQIEKVFYPRLKVEIQNKIQQNIFQ